MTISKFRFLTTTWTHNSKSFILYVYFNGASTSPFAACSVNNKFKDVWNMHLFQNSHRFPNGYFQVTFSLPLPSLLPYLRYLLTIFTVISVNLSDRLVWKNSSHPLLFYIPWPILNSSANIFLQCMGIEGNRGILVLSGFNYFSPWVCHSFLFTGDALWFFQIEPE